jgi:hypothetical protein
MINWKKVIKGSGRGRFECPWEAEENNENLQSGYGSPCQVSNPGPPRISSSNDKHYVMTFSVKGVYETWRQVPMSLDKAAAFVIFIVTKVWCTLTNYVSAAAVITMKYWWWINEKAECIGRDITTCISWLESEGNQTPPGEFCAAKSSFMYSQQIEFSGLTKQSIQLPCHFFNIQLLAFVH